MKEHPIIFSGPMVRAILEDRKTQTRRVILKPERYNHIRECVYCCPYGIERSRLWVRETWRLLLVNGVLGGRAEFATIQFKEKFGVLDYRKDWREHYRKLLDREAPLSANGVGDMYGPWHPSIYMPRWASRITLEITDVRVERVQEISEEDAIAEGIEQVEKRAFGYKDYEGNVGATFQPWQSFMTLWDSINLKRGYGWDTNPWVWMLSFKRKD